MLVLGTKCISCVKFVNYVRNFVKIQKNVTQKAEKVQLNGKTLLLQVTIQRALILTEKFKNLLTLVFFSLMLDPNI